MTQSNKNKILIKSINLIPIFNFDLLFAKQNLSLSTNRSRFSNCLSRLSKINNIEFTIEDIRVLDILTFGKIEYMEKIDYLEK